MTLEVAELVAITDIIAKRSGVTFTFPMRSFVGKCCYGTFTGVPVLMTGEPDMIQIWSDGRICGYVQFFLDEYKWVTRHDLHGNASPMRFATLDEACTMTVGFMGASTK